MIAPMAPTSGADAVLPSLATTHVISRGYTIEVGPRHTDGHRGNNWRWSDETHFSLFRLYHRQLTGTILESMYRNSIISVT